MEAESGWLTGQAACLKDMSAIPILAVAGLPSQVCPGILKKRNYRLHIAISPIKNHDRLEWFIEKSVEIGIDEITPLICRNTEKPGIKSERLNNIIISAMKQSIKALRPVLNEAVSFSEFSKA